MIDLDALKAAGLNSRENSERLLAQHRARQVASIDDEPDPCLMEKQGITELHGIAHA